uniref:SKI/SNO/DAC domain-containing protein n=1 Tax=Haplochromis burtoni TaxID=8153 RepID=A0A3Q2W012_HAPBU
MLPSFLLSFHFCFLCLPSFLPSFLSLLFLLSFFVLLPAVPFFSFPSFTSSGSGLCSECKLVEVHGVKVASFSVDGQELICLPQVFDLFLKHLVGGLHTVYTKLKRLDITPVVCTVEQVRVLRGLGAIQPGVNRCKLISRKDFETLYQDCTSARSVRTLRTFSYFKKKKQQKNKKSLSNFQTSSSVIESRHLENSESV